MSTEWEAGDISRKAHTQPHWPKGPGQGLALIVKLSWAARGAGRGTHPYHACHVASSQIHYLSSHLRLL